MDELEDKFNEQEERYVVLMEEKRLEEQRLFDLKLAEFLRLRACKKIQRWWRPICEKRMRRMGKGPKGKKGKKKRIPQGSPMNTIMAAEAKMIISAMRGKS